VLKNPTEEGLTPSIILVYSKYQVKKQPESMEGIMDRIATLSDRAAGRAGAAAPVCTLVSVPDLFPTIERIFTQP
jgi:hypothetical protein